MGKTQKAQFFDEKFDPITVTQNLLPFFHSCDALSFRQILSARKLIPSRCTIFENEDLLYLFYGRPAYKSSNNASSGLHSLLPISLILKTDAINSFKRVAPFDTGAFNIGLYKEYMHPKMKMNDFFLTPNKAAISKTVNFFFESNEKYFMSRPKSKIDYDIMQFEIQSYFELLKAVGQGKVDDRKASFEIQMENEIQLSRQTIEAVILPEDFLASKTVQEIIINDLQAETITYESYGIPSPSYYSEMLSMTKDYLVKKKHLYV